MQENRNGKFPATWQRGVLATLALGMAATPGVYAKVEKAASKHAEKIILVRPVELPEVARQSGEAMFLHETPDGKTLLFIEQGHGARLAILNVTDPGKIKEEGAIELDGPGTFDFVTPLGDRAELIRFRQTQGVAVLDLRKVKMPTMKMVQGLDLQALKERLGSDGFLFAGQTTVQAGVNTQDYKIVETTNSRQGNRVLDVNGVREEIANERTGTTFLLTADGLYVVRRPAVEEEKNKAQEELENQLL